MTTPDASTTRVATISRESRRLAGVLLLLALVALRYVDDAELSERMKGVVRHAIPAAAILLPAAFFLSVLSPDATEPNALINLAYLGALSLAAGLLVLGVLLLRHPRPADRDHHDHEEARRAR
jgi:hypothetical protein